MSLASEPCSAARRLSHPSEECSTRFREEPCAFADVVLKVGVSLHRQLLVSIGSLLQFLDVGRRCCRRQAEDRQAESNCAHGSPPAEPVQSATCLFFSSIAAIAILAA